MDERELDIESVSNGSYPLGAPGIRAHNDGVSPLWDVLLDPLQDRGLGIKIVHGDVKEPLDLTKSRLLEGSLLLLRSLLYLA